MIVYLAGAINGKSDADARDWRAEATAKLAACGIRVLDPMARDYRGVEAANIQAIVEGDLDDIDRAHVLLVNAETPSWGTAMEVALASRSHRGKIIAFCSRPQPSPWLLYHASVLPDLASALAAVIALK